MKFIICIFVLSIFAQVFAKPKPDDAFQEFIESLKQRFNNALNQVHEMANRAIETIKGSLMNSFETAQNATKDGMEALGNWAKAGETTAKKFIEDTAMDNSTGQIPPIQPFYNEIRPEYYPPGQMPQP